MSVKDFLNNLFDEQKTETEEKAETAAEPVTRTYKEEPIVEKTEMTARQESARNTTSYAKAPQNDVGAGAAVLELKVVRPEAFSSVGQIADHLLNRCTVVLNLEAAEADTARRIVDFLNGVAYSIDGEIKPVANNTFIIVPKNVSITGEQLKESKNGGGNASDEF
ncbi:MAG: cell division protein SepF [Eubacteriales bacterium]